MPSLHVPELFLAGALTVAGLPDVLALAPVNAQAQAAAAQVQPSGQAQSPVAAQPPIVAQPPGTAQPSGVAQPVVVPQQMSSPAQVPAPSQVPALSQGAPALQVAPTPHAATPGPSATTPAPSGAGQGAGTERRVKAEFLYKFLGYTEFPATAFADAASAVQIGVAGSDDMLAELTRTVAGRTVNGRPVTIKPVREGEAPGPLHLLFIAGSDCALAARLLRGMPAKLPVTECEGGLQTGSVINFRMVDEHVRFDVSLDAAEKNNVRLSSRLLNVANHVQKGTL